ncbi:MAG: serine hydrolase domain-containing protein [Haloechinothrix sp.]
MPLPRLPFGPDPLRRARVPKDVESVTARGIEADPADVGMTSEGIERIWEGVAGVYRGGAHPAIALCVRRAGRVVLDRAIGHARGNGPRDAPGADMVAVGTDTPFCVYSASKAITATVVHLLDERGQLHIDDRVCEYIPEFGKHGKDAITIGQVLAHRSGIPNHPREALDLDQLGNRELMLRLLCEAKPFSKPGQFVAYHALSGGAVLGEIVERVMGKNIREVLATEILQPLGFRWTNYGVASEDVPKVATNYVTGAPVLPPLSTMLTRLLGAPVGEAVELSNDPRYLTGVVPAGNIVSTANELSRFFELLRRGGEMDGLHILEPRTIRRAITKQTHLEVDFTFGVPIGYSFGFMLGGKRISLFGPDTEQVFGHLGFTNILGWADPARGLSVGLITSGKPVVYPEIFDFLGIMGRIGAAAPKVDQSELTEY